MEPLRKFAEAIEANLSPEEQTFLAALCDDTTLAGPPATVVTLYLKLRKMAKEIYNLDFHQGSKCKAYSPASFSLSTTIAYTYHVLKKYAR